MPPFPDNEVEVSQSAALAQDDRDEAEQHPKIVTKQAFRARIAVAVLFIVNSLPNAWIPRIAEVQRNLSLSELELGAILGVGSIGGLIGGPLAGCMISKVGSARSSVIWMVVTVIALPFLGLLNGPVLLSAVLFILSATDAIVDASMNAHGMRVQELYGRSIINSFHGFWSLGTVTGGAVGVLCANIGVSLLWMLLGVAIVCLIGVVSTARWLLPGLDPQTFLTTDDDDEVTVRDLETVELGEQHTQKKQETKSDTSSSHPCSSICKPVIWGLGAFIILSVLLELIPMQWSAIYLSSIGVSEDLEGTAYIAFTVAMTIGRFTGDALVDRFTSTVWTRITMAATAVAMVVSLLFSNAILFTCACVLTGFSVATLFPSALTASAYLPGVAPGTAVSLVSWLSRAGFFAAPVLVGSIANSAGTTWGFSLIPTAACILIFAAGILKYGDNKSAK